jgi:hypothetical protein
MFLLLGWIDIGLIFNDQFMNRILGFLSDETLCTAAADTITEVCHHLFIIDTINTNNLQQSIDH